MADLRTLERVASGLRGLGGLAARVAPELGRVMRADVLDHVRRGVGPDEQPWEETEDGHLPLQGVGKDLSVRATAKRVVLTLRGVGARHHAGEVRGGIAREILPTDRVPDSMVRALERVVVDDVRRTLGGG